MYPQGNQLSAVHERHGVKVPLVTWIRPEIVRSIPGQVEADLLDSWRTEEVLRASVLVTWE